MRARMMVVVGALLLSACAAEGDEDLLIEVDELGVSVSIIDAFENPEAWWSLGQQDLGSFAMVQADIEAAVFYGTGKSWVGRAVTVGLPPPSWECTLTARVEVRAKRVAHLRVKIREAGQESSMINHSFYFDNRDPFEDRALVESAVTPSWTPPASGEIVVNLIADQPDAGEVNGFEIPRLRYTCWPKS